MAVCIQIITCVLPLLTDVLFRTCAIAGPGARPPANNRIVIMCSCICNKIPGIVVRSEGRSLRIGAEGELKDRHARKVKVVPYCFHLWRNDSQVLCQNGQIAQYTLHDREDLYARSFRPAPIDRGGFSGRHLPISLEATKMIDAHQ